MSKRGHIHDFTGAPIVVGDTVVYATRQANRVRMTEAVILKTTSAIIGGRVVPLLKVKPTGQESGFVRRRSFRVETIAAEHVAVTIPGDDI
ncbi:hypothetical protein [Streptomyces natalensis]|uniref:hypothetical protein n=1 Tax=Streptomyces natalensis TaxID=68242 RepID=UPI00099E0C3B|nr:hypothetical protein [Streptomyces natalensis]